jgi:hypothetical protein
MSETTTRHGAAWRAYLRDHYGAGDTWPYDYHQPAGPHTATVQADRDARRLEGLITARTILQRGLDAGTVPVALRGKLAERIARTDAAIAALSWPVVTTPPPF